MKTDYSYYDELYFQDGSKRGTAYSNYLEGSRSSATYRELAETIATVFRPRRALEIGCATGIIVRYLNDAGIEAHGIDVSSWAIEHREHPHVVLAGAEALPFPDEHFDLVYSVHALEHMPPHLLRPAIAEITRVCPTGTQFHMLPILGEGPYGGSREAAIAGLKKDPTHQSLHDRAEWLAVFAAQGWCDTGLRAAIFADTNTGELSVAQFIIVRPGLPPGLGQRIAGWNFGRAQLASAKARAPAGHAAFPALADDSCVACKLPRLVFGAEEAWLDLQRNFAAPIDLSGGRLRLLLRNLAGRRLAFRVALQTEAAGGHLGMHVMERWIEAEHGLTILELPISDLVPLHGAPDPSRVIRCFLGGKAARAELRAQLVLEGPAGSATAFAAEVMPELGSAAAPSSRPAARMLGSLVRQIRFLAGRPAR